MNRRSLSFAAVAGFGALFCAALPARAQTAPTLGTAESFAVLGGQTVTNTGPTVVTGDLGVSPGAAVTNFPPGLVVGGTIHAADALAGTAQNDLTIAYNALAAESCTQNLTGQDLGGLTLTPGVYCFDVSAQLTGVLTLDAGGDADAVFIFKIGSTLTTASNASVLVINGGLNCNTFWQVGSSATLGTGTIFAGNILALTSITLTTGAQVFGRVLARNGAVTLDTNTVNSSACTAIVPPGPCPAIVLSPATLPNATLGVAYSQTITATGGTAPYTFTVLSGVPPVGVTVTPVGALTGISNVAGASTFTVRATDASGCTATLSYTLTTLAAVPTLTEWAMIGLTALLMLSGYLALRRRTA